MMLLKLLLLLLLNTNAVVPVFLQAVRIAVVDVQVVVVITDAVGSVVVQASSSNQ